MKELSKIQGHIVLYCKSHYSVNGVDKLLGLRRIWATRCGLDNKHTENKSADRYIADFLFELIQSLSPEKLLITVNSIHENLASPKSWYTDLTPIEIVIMDYVSRIWNIQVKEKRGEKYFNLVKLPKPKVKVFTRIVAGKAKFNDYKLIM